MMAEWKRGISETCSPDALEAALTQPLPDQLRALLEKAGKHEKWPVAQLVSIFERQNFDSTVARHQLETYLNNHEEQYPKHAAIIGITGTPGAGKSSLIGEVCLELLKQQPELSIAVLAIDPSSQESGGALLGDRTRTLFPINDKRLFFRSQASHQDLGGMGKTTYQVSRILRRLFDLIIIETVGIGQSEIEVQRLSDHTFLVMQPLAGDQVQFMKAGIMEVPDTFIINKCDEDILARKSLHLLRASLKLARIHLDNETPKHKNILLTSAIKQKGIGELSGQIVDLLEEVKQHSSMQATKHREYFLRKNIAQDYGEFGLAIYDATPKEQSANSLATYEQQELAFSRLINDYIKPLN